MERFNGRYGIVIIPDRTTVRLAQDLSRLERPSFVFAGERTQMDFVPEYHHLTLFHARLVDAPEEAVHEILNRLTGLPGQAIHLNGIRVYGEKFLFWDADISPVLKEVHEIALGLAKFLDPSAKSCAEEEMLEMSPEERANIEQFGHPLVRDHYRPHVTLGWNARGFEGLYPCPATHHAHVRRVVFAEIGDYGCIKRIIYSRS